MASTPAKKAAPDEAEKPVAKTAAKTGAKPAGADKSGQGNTGATKARSAKVAAAREAGAGPLVEKANLEVKLKDLIEKVTTATGAKKPQVRAVIEAMLKEMGDALAASQVLNLPGFGKVRVVRQAETPTGTMTIKLRRGPGGGPGKAQGKARGKAQAEGGAEPLAETGEDS